MNILLVFSINLIGLFFLIVNSILYASKIAGKDKVYRILTIYLLILAIQEIACNIIGFLKPNSNTFIVHFNFNMQLIFLSFFFYQLFAKPIQKKMVVIVYIIVFIGLVIQYSFNPGLFWQFNIPEIVIISLVLISYSLIHIYNSLGEKREYFYFTIGLIMYLLCSAIIFLSGKFELVFYDDPYIDIWVFNSIFFIVYQCLIFKEWKTIHTKNIPHVP